MAVKHIRDLECVNARLDPGFPIAVIDAHYNFTPTAFRNGELHNAAGQNNGSCKVFSYAKLQQLSAQQTLQCFGAYYRDDVLKNPHASDHQNIRNFIKFGWDGVEFECVALVIKGSGNAA